jgi:hypothetical protein
VTGLEVDEDRTVCPPAPQRPVIDTEDPGRPAHGQRCASDESEQAVRTGRHGQRGEEARARLAADLHGDPSLGGGQASGALRVGVEEPTKGLGERATCTAGVLAVEPPHVHREADALPERGEIGGPAHVSAVRGGAAPPAVRADGPGSSRADHEQELTVELPLSLDVASGHGIRGQRNAWCYPTLPPTSRRAHRGAPG